MKLPRLRALFTMKGFLVALVVIVVGFWTGGQAFLAYTKRFWPEAEHRLFWGMDRLFTAGGQAFVVPTDYIMYKTKTYIPGVREDDGEVLVVAMPDLLPEGPETKAQFAELGGIDLVRYDFVHVYDAARYIGFKGGACKPSDRLPGYDVCAVSRIFMYSVTYVKQGFSPPFVIGCGRTEYFSGQPIVESTRCRIRIPLFDETLLEVMFNIKHLDQAERIARHAFDLACGAHRPDPAKPTTLNTCRDRSVLP